MLRSIGRRDIRDQVERHEYRLAFTQAKFAGITWSVN